MLLLLQQPVLQILDRIEILSWSQLNSSIIWNMYRLEKEPQLETQTIMQSSTIFWLWFELDLECFIAILCMWSVWRTSIWITLTSIDHSSQFHFHSATPTMIMTKMIERRDQEEKDVEKRELKLETSFGYVLVNLGHCEAFVSLKLETSLHFFFLARDSWEFCLFFFFMGLGQNTYFILFSYTNVFQHMRWEFEPITYL